MNSRGVSLAAVARRFDFVRESAPNDGVWVSWFLRHTGNKPGEAWCASFVSVVLSIAYRGQSPLKPTAGCKEMLAEATAKGFAVVGAPAIAAREATETEPAVAAVPAGAPVPQEDDIFFYMKDGLPHHVGIVTRVHGGAVVGIAGNTSQDGASSNGTGVFEHDLAHVPMVFVRVP